MEVDQDAALFRHHAHGQASPMPISPMRSVDGRKHAFRSHFADMPQRVLQDSLLGGNQAATLQAVSPDIRRLTDVSRGAQSAIDTRLTGAARQQATADLLRNRYADIAALTGAPRQQAAATLLGEGAAGSTGLTGALGTAGSMYGAQGAGYGQSYQNAMDRLRDVNKQWADFGTGLTKTLGPNWIQSLLGRGGDLPNVDLPKTGTSIWKTENWRPRFVK